MPNSAQLFDTLRRYVDEIDARKKQATDGVGETTHPSDDVDGGTQDPSTGARAAENEADVKADVPGVSVDEASSPSATETEQNGRQPNIGPQQSATGEDPSVEDDYKSDKDDPGTTHPAKADDGEKYASASFDQLTGRFTKLADSILADVAVGPADRTAAKPAAKSAGHAAAAGYVAAATAEDAQGRAGRTIEDTIKEAHHAADLAAEFLPRLYDQLRKQAEGEEIQPPDDGAQESPGDADDGSAEAPLPPDAGGAPPAHGGSGAPGGGGEEILSQLLGQPEAPPSHDEAMGGLNGAMDDMQISPEVIQQIIALLQQSGAEGGGEAPIKQARLLSKAASEARKFRLSGKYEVGPAKTARARAIRADMRSFLSEILTSVPQLS